MSEWIKTSYLQPWPDTAVIVCVDDDVFEAVYREDEYGNPFCFEQITSTGSRGHMIDEGPETHWMPLPEPPED